MFPNQFYTPARSFTPLIKKPINWSGLLTNTQKPLNIVNQAIPIVYQIKPIVNNARTIFKVANEFSKTNSNNNSNNTGNTNTGSGNNGAGNGSNDSGANKPVDTEKPESTEKDTEKPADTEKDTEKPVPDTEKPVEDTECKHTNTFAGANGNDTHDILCRDCFINKDIEIVLGTEPCNYAGGSCKCGTSCPHKNTTEVVESTDKSGRCGFTCNQCGWTSLLQHEIYWDNSNFYEACGRCSTIWPCDHGGGANLVLVRGFEEHEYHCTSCRSLVSSEPHTYVNGSCSVCGWSDPNWNPEPPVEGGGAGEEIPIEPVEDGVTGMDIVKVWKHICRYR